MNDMAPLPARTLSQIADRVRGRYARAQRDYHEIANDIGRELLAAKSLLPHGDFLRWLSHEFDFSVQTAHNFMNYADAFPGQISNVRNLPISTAYQIAKPTTPASVRERVLKQAEENRLIDPRDVMEQIKREKEAARAAVKVAKLPPRKRKTAEQQAAEFARREADIVAKNEAERQLGVEAAMMIEKALGDDLAVFVDKLRRGSIYDFRRYFLG